MSFYEQHFLPHIIDSICGLDMFRQQRALIVPQAKGRVLEIGMGTGLNLPFYDSDKVDFIWGLEPSSGMRHKAHKRLNQTHFDVHWLHLPGEQIPLEDKSVDTVLLTYTLCTIPDWQKALQEMRRVLKPDGELLFCEHGIAPDQRIRSWQEKLNPLWGRAFGGCHLNRPIPQYLQEGGFKIQSIESKYIASFLKIASFNYWGIAK